MDINKKTELILNRLKELPEKNVYIIAIDGRAAAGKTTLAEHLAKRLGIETIRMDDFFLPSELRTEQRYLQAGGNIHYERFSEEILLNIKNQEAFSYRIFDCKTMSYGSYRTINKSKYRIVEGSYSLHPEFGKYADISVFCDVNPSIQMERILNRNGKEMAEMFKSKWIPLEEHYFDEFNIRKKAELIL